MAPFFVAGTFPPRPYLPTYLPTSQPRPSPFRAHERSFRRPSRRLRHGRERDEGRWRKEERRIPDVIANAGDLGLVMAYGINSFANAMMNGTCRVVSCRLFHLRRTATNSRLSLVLLDLGPRWVSLHCLCLLCWMSESLREVLEGSDGDGGADGPAAFSRRGVQERPAEPGG